MKLSKLIKILRRKNSLKILVLNISESSLRKLLHICMGITFLGYILYRRFFIIRLPKSLWILNPINFKDINYNIAILIITSICISTYIIYKSIQLIKRKTTKKSMFSAILERLNTFIDNALLEIYSLVMTRIPRAYWKISPFGFYFYETFSVYSESIFVLIPFLMRTIIFLWFKLHYIYKALYLLGVSLIIKVIFYILKDLASNLEIAESFLIITPQGINKHGEPITKYKLRLEHYDADLDYHIGQYILCSKMSGYLEFYEHYRQYFTPYFNVILHSGYVITWIFILCKNILTFLF